MPEEKKAFNPRAPDYKDRSNVVSVWVDTDKEGKTLLKVKVFNSQSIYCFKNEPKPSEPEL